MNKNKININKLLELAFQLEQFGEKDSAKKVLIEAKKLVENENKIDWEIFNWPKLFANLASSLLVASLGIIGTSMDLNQGLVIIFVAIANPAITFFQSAYKKIELAEMETLPPKNNTNKH